MYCRVFTSVLIVLVFAAFSPVLFEHLGTQDEIDHLFNSIVIPKLLNGLSVYAASVSELTVIQRML